MLKPATTTRRRQARRFIVAALVVALIVLTLPIALTSGLRARLTAALGERFGSEVELAALRVSVLPRLRVSGEGVVLRHKGRTDVPPLISVASFSAEANLWGLIGKPVRLKRVRVEGLEINLPPRDKDDDTDDEPTATATRAEREPPPQQAPTAPPPDSPLMVDHLVAEHAVFKILRRDPEKEARVWDIAHLVMERTGWNEPWPFQASLTNPIPPGNLEVRGTFGPWDADQPSDTPLGASYEFQQADLGFFKGIQGTLQSSGKFNGTIKRIEVEGTTNVPEFALDNVGQPVPLTTTFNAIVDGTNGNVWLRPVNATFAKSSLTATGAIVEPEKKDGRTLALDVVMSDARVEDVLRLVIKSSTPALIGGLKLKTSFLLPPGKADVIEKMQLDGSFEIASARFSKGTLQAKMNELSQKAQGDGESDEPPDRVASNFTGRFVMKGGIVNFSRLTFAVPGATLDLTGSFTVKSEALDFRGQVRMDAKLSQMTSGFKSFLLKAVDPLVRRKGSTVIPITIKGTAEKPDFGLDVKRTLLRK